MALEIHPMCLGEVGLHTGFLVWDLMPGTPVQAPCTSYLVLGGDTPLMIDAGIAGPGGPFTQTPEQTLEANLARHGLEPGDIGILLHTHVHVDHCGYDDALPNARIIIQREELEYAAAPLFPPFLYDSADHAKLVGPLRDRVELIEGDTQIAPGVRTVFTGGHTPAHQMVYVDVPSGQAIVTGDNVYLVDPGLTEQRPPGYYVNLFEVTEALRRIQRDADHVLPMHDAAVYERYPDGIR
jgi:glyoxylase-like metal-dependent hydrolase (beta-lactamase superfamily II)